MTPVEISGMDLQRAIGAVEEAGSAEELLLASRRLAALAHPDAAGTLIAILGYNNPGAAVASVEGLIAIGEPAVRPLLDNLDARNYGARAWAVRALAGLADPRGLEVLVDSLLHDVGPSVRRAAARGLGDLRLSDETGVTRCLEALVRGAGDGEWVVRYAVAVGLERRLSRPPLIPDLQRRGAEALEQRLASTTGEEVAVVRERAVRALRRIREAMP
jgi:phycocyanobilin lyase beta subunit